jgi:ubiquinone/menaquinone biosynthesis C-methylase UbiE
MQEPAEFDKFARDYRDIHNENIRFTGGSSDYFAQYKIELTHKLVGDKQISQILDLGCGDGLSDFFFNSYFPQATISGIDPSGESIQAAMQRGIPACTFTTYDGSHIPFPEKSFDLIFLSCILHHVPSNQHPSLLAECCRVLRPGGMIFIFEHNPLNPITRKIVRDCEFDADAVLLTSGNLRRLFQKQPLNNIRVRFTLFLPRHRLFTWLLSIEKWLGWIPLGGQYVIYASRN